MNSLLIYALIVAALLPLIVNSIAIRFIIKHFTLVIEFINEEEIELGDAYLRITEGDEK